MYKVINEYMSMVNLVSSDEISGRIEDTLAELASVKRFSVSVNFNQYVVDIKLDKYSVESAGKTFAVLQEKLSYPHSCLYVRFNEGKCVRYRFLSSKEDKEAIYCDFIFS